MPIFKDFTKPLYKGVKRNANGVRRVLALPCQTPVGIYIETLFPAAIQAFFSFASPDPKEVYHLIRGKSFICDVTSFGHTTLGSLATEGDPVTRFFFKNIALYDVATWWFFIADIASEGLSNWTSGIYNMRECPDKNNPNYFSGGYWGGAIHSNGPWGTIDFDFHNNIGGGGKGPPSATAAPGRHVTVAASAKFTLEDFQPVGTSSRVLIENTDTILDFHQNFDVNDDEAHGSNHVWWSGRNTLGEVAVYSAQWFCDFGPAPGGNQVFPDPDFCHAVVAT